jgi:hypothetical protein
MKTKLVLFGKHIDMATRSRRRWLVAIFYGVFGALLIRGWVLGSHTGGGFLTIEFTILVGPILGGYFAHISGISGGRGLVEPFRPQKILKYPESASFLRPSTLLHPVVDDDPELRTDERALRRRDYAHYVAHGFLGALVAAAFILEFCNYSGLIGDIANNALSSGSVHRIVYCLLQIGYISSMTLPQAILLWTEPDMEEPQKTS